MPKLIITFLILIFLGCLSSSAQRINAVGRKMVKTVRVYKWRSAGYELRKVFTMEYNDRNELVKFYNGENVVFVRHGHTIVADTKGYTKNTYQLNSDGKIISAEEHEYFYNSKYDPYYTVLTFTYGDNGKLWSIVDKHLYHVKGKEYKENIQDRRYIQCEYKDGGTYYMDGGVSIKGNDYLVPWVNHAGRHYHTDAVYDINFNIEACELSQAGHREYLPMLTEWCPCFPEYWLKSLDFKTYSKLWDYRYDERGNVISIDMPYSDGYPNMRYEIEYVY